MTLRDVHSTGCSCRPLGLDEGTRLAVLSLTAFLFTPPMSSVAQRNLLPGDANEDFRISGADFAAPHNLIPPPSSNYPKGPVPPTPWDQGNWWGLNNWDRLCVATRGAPNPTSNDNQYNWSDIVTMLQTGWLHRGPYMCRTGGGAPILAPLLIEFDEDSGELSVDVPPESELTSILLESASGIFTRGPAQNLTGPVDFNDDNIIFRSVDILDPDFEPLEDWFTFGQVVQPGLSVEDVRNDIVVRGSFNPDPNIDPFDQDLVLRELEIVSPAVGADFVLDFATDPEALGVEFHGTAEWREDSGNPGGYLSITDALNSQRGAIVFPDLGEGATLTQFSISAELRVGGGTARPADGFSFNFARPDDPVLDDGEDWASSPTGEANLPEEGTTTGLAIGFDEWFSGGDDVVGISIRIDDELVDQFEFPVLNGELDDVESLQTGPEGVLDDELDLLGWAKLNIHLTSDNNLKVDYKGVEVFNQVIDYDPSPGLLVFGGRTGGANAYHHIDNIIIRTGDNVGAKKAGMGAASLQAGDANQDLEFNQLDLVQVQIAGTYLTGNPATWGGGDWDGAPGGSPGSPPPGNGLFDQLDIIAALNGGVYLTGPYAAVAAGGSEGDGQTSIGYDPGTGQVWVDAPAGSELTSVNIDSAGGIFTGEAAANLGGSFDNDADDNIFKATFGGSFGTTSFGNVAQSGLSEDFLLNDLTVVGSLAGGGDLGNVDLIYVPEASTMLLMLLGLASLATGTRVNGRV